MELLFERALLPDGIAHQVGISVTAGGALGQIVPGAGAHAAATRIPGLALCGMPNLHSHAFQRGIAGTTELSASAQNSFWGWRETMYRFVERLQPDDVAAIAALAYVEMLESGYTSVAEFHYLHHQADGAPYPDAAMMSIAVRSAAAQAGIRQLLLPCLYQTSGFGSKPILPAQRRFAHDTTQWLRLFERLRGDASALQTTGIALHSLRAVPASALRDACRAVPTNTPIHIHVSEQQREVEECLSFSGRRPIEYLLETVAVDPRWCVVHATHASASELQALRSAGAVVGLCPTTEANLGDGLFPLEAFLASGGRFGIGSDSQVSIDPREELRSAEYALRLWTQRRGLVGGAQAHCGTALYSQAAAGGAQALGIGVGQLLAGEPADLVVIDTDQAQFAGIADDALIDTHIFAPRPGSVRDVMVGGQWVVREGRHPKRDAIAQAYRRCIERLLQ